MVMAENLVVKGRYFFPIKAEQIPERIGSLKNTLQEYLAKKFYEPEDIRTIFFQDRFLTANYSLSFGRLEIPLRLKLKKNLGLLTEEKIQTKLYFEKLDSRRNEIPYKIKICLSPQKINNVDGIVIEITSIPVAYYKISQINKNLHLDKSDYSMVKHENAEFIKEIMGSIHAQTLSEPNFLSDYIKNEISQKLSTYKFDKIAKLLDDGKKKLEIGENAVGDIIGVIENFLFELLERANIEPARRDQPEKNILKLKMAGFLNDKTEGTIQSSLFHSVYRKLKDCDHKKEDIDYFDSVLYFGITESIIDYLLDKVVKYRIKSNVVVSSSKKEKDD